MPTIDILWGVVGILVPMLIGIGMSFVGMSPPAFRAARVCFISAALVLGGMEIVWYVQTGYSLYWRVGVGCLICLTIGIMLPEGIRWVNKREIAFQSPKPPISPSVPPSYDAVVEKKKKSLPENQFASLSKQQLLDITKDTLGDLDSVANTWKFKIDDTNDKIHTRMRSAYKDDGHGHSRPWTDEEKTEYRRPLDRELEEAGREIRISASHTIPKLCDLHAEIVYRLDFWRRKLIPPVELERALFDKLRTEIYTYDDLKNALKYVADVKNGYEQRDPDLFPR